MAAPSGTIFLEEAIVDASGSSTVQGDTSITIASTAAQTTSPISYLAGGGFVQNESSASVASANVQGNTNITIEEGADVTVREIVGGGVGDVWTGGAATADVQGSTHITLEGGRAVLVFGGGSANNGSSSASSVSASVQTSCITIAGGSHGAVFGGGIAQSKGPGTARASVEDAHITVSGGSIMMLFAAGWADGTGASTAHDEGSTHAEVRMEGGSVEELWAGAYTSNGGQAGRLDVETHITGGTITGSLLAGNFTGDGPGKADPGSQVSIFLGGTASVQDGIVVSTDQTDIVLADSARVSTLNNTPVLDIAANQTQVTLRGNCVQIDGRFQAQGADNSLTFDQYQGTFSNSFSGFATLKAEAGSTVELDTLSTADNRQDLTLAGSGLFRANTVQATASHGLTVGNGLQGTTLIVTEGLASGDNITVADGARLSVSGTLTDEGTLSGIEGTVLVQAGGIYDVATQETALTGEALTALWDSLLKEGSDGLLILGNVVLTDLETAADGHILYNDVLDGVLAKNQYLQTADVADEFLDGEGVRGAFTGIHLTGNATALTVRETLVLAGGSSNGFLAWYGTGEEARAADLHIGHISANAPDKHSAVVTLGLEEASNSGTLGHVCMDAGDGTATLNVLGAGSATFTTSDIHTAEESRTVINVRGALLQTGSLAASSAPLDELSVTSAAVRVQGDAYLGDLILQGGTLSSEADAGSSGSIRVGGTLSGQGFLAAEAELELKDYKGAESDMLALRADTVTAGSLDSGQGGLAIEAQSLATGTCLLTGDSVIARDWTLNGDLAARDTLIQVERFAAGAGSTGDASVLGQALALEGNSLLVHGSRDGVRGDLASRIREATARAGFTGTTCCTDRTLQLQGNASLSFAGTDSEEGAGEIGNNTAVSFGKNTLLIVETAGMTPGQALFTHEQEDRSARVGEGSWLYVPQARSGLTFTVFGQGFATIQGGWSEDCILTETDMLAPDYDAKTSVVSFTAREAREVYPDLGSEVACTVNELYTEGRDGVQAPEQGIRLLSRATSNRYLGRDKAAASRAMESVPRMALAAAVPQMTRMAADAATSSAVGRLSLARMDNGSKAMNADGTPADEGALGLALWIAPLWASQSGFGMEAGSLDYGCNANLGGVALGADSTWAGNFRAGLLFTLGGGFAQSSGDVHDTTNSMSFWGLGAYAGWKDENFALMGDVSYTSTWNSVNQDVDARLGMSDLEADIQASALSAGLRAEYRFETPVLDLIPHAGVRYMSLSTWGYEVDNSEGTVLESDGFAQSIWTFPVGITFSREVEMNGDWSFRPFADVTLLPAAGDLKAREDVCFTGLDAIELRTRIVDDVTWQGSVGLELGSPDLSVAVNYTLQAGRHSTGHGVFGMFRCEF